MSDSPPPPKPKPGSLRDRIAAFESKPATPGPAPPPVRPKPTGNVSWKPRATSPPPAADNAASEPTPPKKTGAFSAADAMESIGKAGSLKDRMAALKSQGAFGAAAPPAPPKPASDKPKWKPPPVASPPAEESPATPPELGIPSISSPKESDRQLEAPTPELVVSSGADEFASGGEGEHGEQDAEEEERQRRAAIAARMARLGGARLGMAPPIARKPERKKSVEEEQAVSATTTPVIEAVPDLETPTSEEPTALEAPADALDAVPARATPQRQGSAVSALSTESVSSAKPSPTSMPMPTAPRRAGPPRKKAFKSPSPAHTIEQVVVTSPEPVAATPPSLDETPSIAPASESDVQSPPVATFEQAPPRKSPDIAVVAEPTASQAPPEDKSAIVPDEPTPSEATIEGDREAVHVAETSVEETLYPEHAIVEPQAPAESEPEVIAETVVSPEEGAEPIIIEEVDAEPEQEVVTEPEFETTKARVEEAPEPDPTSTLESTEEAVPASTLAEEGDEEDEGARRQRIAARVAKMGGFNPFGAPTLPPPSRQESAETSTSPLLVRDDTTSSYVEHIAIEDDELVKNSETTVESEDDALVENEDHYEDAEDLEDPAFEPHVEEAQEAGPGTREEAKLEEAEGLQPSGSVPLSEVVGKDDGETSEVVESSGYEEDAEDKDEVPEDRAWTPPTSKLQEPSVVRRSLPPPPRSLPIATHTDKNASATPGIEEEEFVYAPEETALGRVAVESEQADEQETETPQMVDEVYEEEGYEEDVEVGTNADAGPEVSSPPVEDAPAEESAPSPPARPVHRGSLPTVPVPVTVPPSSPSPSRASLPPVPHPADGGGRRMSRGSLPPVPVPAGLSRAGSISRSLPPPPRQTSGQLPPIKTRRPKEVLDEEDGDPIDPQFHSPRSPLPHQGFALPPGDNSPLPSVQPTESEDDAEQSRRRTLAERMAKLGGIKFGAPPPVPSSSSRPLPTVPQVGEEAETAIEETQGEQEPMDEEAEESARRQRIAAKLAGMGAMRFGMVPTMPARAASGSPGRPAPESSGLQRTPSLRGPLPKPPAVPTSQEDPEILEEEDGVQVEAEESELEEVTYTDAEEEAPAVPTRTGRQSSAEVPPALPPGRHGSSGGRPPVPATPTGGYQRQNSGQVQRQGPSDYHRQNSDFVVVDEPEAAADMDAPPPPLRPTHHPSRALPPQPPSGPAGWELPSIPSGSFDLGGGIDLSSSTFSEDSTNYATADTETEYADLPPPVPPTKPMSPTPQIASPPARNSLDVQLSSDELTMVWGRVGVHVAEVAAHFFEKSKKSLVGDGSFAGFVDAVLSQVPNAARPSSYGQLIYGQTAGSVQKRVSDIMPGDVVIIEDAKFKGHKGLKSYTQQVGFGDPVIGVVGESEHKKSKIKVYQANQNVGHQTVESVSYRLEDLEIGSVRIFRVLEA